MSRILTRRLPAMALALSLVVIQGSMVATAAAPDYSQPASEVVNNLASGKYDAVVAKFNAELKGKLSAGSLAQVWQGVIAQYGAYQAQIGSDAQTQGKLVVVTVRCRHERGMTDIDVVFDSDGLVGGLWVRAADTGRNIKPPTE